MSELNGEQRNKLLHSTVVPRPIAWISSYSSEGRLNVAPFSFFNLMSGDPPLLSVCIGSRQGRLKDTARNIADTGEFVVNLVSYASIERMNITSIEFDPEIDESTEAKLETVPSRLVKVPRIKESPASFECKTRHALDIDGRRLLVVADIVSAHIDDRAIVSLENMYFDPMALDLVARLHNPGWYMRVADPFKLVTPSVQAWQDTKTSHGSDEQ
ncbi:MULTISPECIES: flavin reductase family protein [Pandoraea]|uniref:flavin reductase family protein n=1 Tax=Pandoraea TaxID=93217 RepID=UPI001F5CC3F6|nr:MULTISPECIES: flavin reductase family protein [Pandoraea]